MDGLDRSVGCPAFRRQGIREAGHALPVEGIYLNCPCAEQLFENAAFLQHDGMRRAILHIQRVVLVFAMIEAGLIAGLGGNLVDVLMQRAAIGDIELLEAAANRKERHGAVHAGADELQRQCIALTVEQHALARRCAAIFLRVHVRVRAGEEDAVAEIEEFCEVIPRSVEGLARHWQENGLTISAAIDGGDVFLAGRMKGMRSQHLDVAGNADDGTPA